MEHNTKGEKNVNGFTLIELMMTFVILGILATVSIPAFSAWLPNYRLKAAVQDLHSNMYLAKIKAIKGNKDYSINFTTTGNQGYTLKGPDGSIEKEVYLSDYGSGDGIEFGWGNATKKATVSGGPIDPEFDGVSYNPNKATFNSRGMGSSGYVYMANEKGASYVVGTWSSGVIVLKKWNESTDSWE